MCAAWSVASHPCLWGLLVAGVFYPKSVIRFWFLLASVLTSNGRFYVKRCKKPSWNIKESEYLYRLFGGLQNFSYLCNRLLKARAFSSAGLEHLPYKQRVGGSNPSTPTQEKDVTHKVTSFFSFMAVRQCVVYQTSVFMPFCPKEHEKRGKHRFMSINQSVYNYLCYL